MSLEHHTALPRALIASHWLAAVPCLPALQSVGGRAATMLKDKTNDESAFIGDEAEGDADGDGDDDGDGSAKPKKAKAKAAGGRKKTSSAASSASSAAIAGDGTGGSCATATCPTCFAPLTVDLMAAPEAAGAGGCCAAHCVGACTAHNWSSRLTSSLAADRRPPAASTAASRKSILSRIPAERVGSGFRSSTKIEALLEDLWKVRRRRLLVVACCPHGQREHACDMLAHCVQAQQEEPGVKAIVFSQFVNMLDLIQHRLTHAGASGLFVVGCAQLAHAVARYHPRTPTMLMRTINVCRRALREA